MATALAPTPASNIETSAPRRLGRGRLARLGQGIVGLLAMVAVWELLRAFGVLPSNAVPSTWSILSAGASGFAHGNLGSATGHTIESWAIGLGLSTIIGIPLGVAIGLSRWAHAATKEIIDFVRPVPSVALVPVALVFLGFGLKMEIVLVVVGSVWPVIFNTRYGVQNVDPLLIDSGRALGLSRRELITRVTIVGALPAILSGLRTAAAIALALAVAAEILAVPEGLGYVIDQSATTGSPSEGYAAILITGLIGVVINSLLGLARSRALRWDGQRGEG